MGSFNSNNSHAVLKIGNTYEHAGQQSDYKCDLSIIDEVEKNESNLNANAHEDRTPAILD